MSVNHGKVRPRVPVAEWNRRVRNQTRHKYLVRHVRGVSTVNANQCDQTEQEREERENMEEKRGKIRKKKGIRKEKGKRKKEKKQLIAHIVFRCVTFPKCLCVFGVLLLLL